MDLYSILVPIHLIGFAFGVGGATASDLVFLRSIRNGKISKDEFNLIKTVSAVVWASVVLLLASGLGLLMLGYFQTGEHLPRLYAGYFQVKVLAFAVLIANGIVFHKYVFPLMRKSRVSFRSPAMKKKYPLFAVTGAISITSWYSAFLLATFGRFLGDFSFLTVLSWYVLLIIMAFGGAYTVISLYAQNKGPVIERIEQAAVRVAVAAIFAALFFGAYIVFLA